MMMMMMMMMMITSTSKEIYDEILEEKIDQILEMSKEISHGDLVYDFKDPTSSINFGKYGGPVYIYGHMKNGKKALQQVEEEQKKNLRRFNRNNTRKSKT